MNAWTPSQPPFDAKLFSGVGRLFPLPQVVAFPHVVTPLHVYEERYRALTAEALGGDGLITLAVLEPGWESDYAGRPPLRPVGCLGKVVSHHADAEGRYNLLVLGLRRVRLLKEIQPPVAFRRSTLEVIDEVDDANDANDADELRSRVIELMLRSLQPGATADEFERTLAREASLGSVTDLAAHSLSFAADLKYALLDERDARTRARLILDAAPKLADGPALGSLPPFSMN